MGQFYFDKESITERISCAVADHLHLKSAKGFDPLTQLLTEAFASELYVLADSIANIEVRLLEKLATTLVPASRTMAMPAHAIMSAQPVEPEQSLTEELSLHYQDYQISSLYQVSSIAFSPVVPVHLKKGNIRYLMTDGKCSIFGKDRKRSLVGEFTQLDSSGVVWLGLDMHPSVISVEGLSFYWDFPQLKNKEEYIRFLSFASWYVNGKNVPVCTGITDEDRKSVVSIQKTLSQYETGNVINTDIYNFYKPHFITITDDCQFSRNLYPAELADQLAGTDLLKQEFTAPLLWIKVCFPPVLQHVLEQVKVSINSFPVAQKQRIQAEVSLNELNSIVPLTVRANEHFLSVQSVCDSQGRIYLESSDKYNTGTKSGSYSVRNGGCERFDGRDAKEYLTRLTDLLMEESAAFGSISKDKVSVIAHEMLQLVNRMRDALGEIGGHRDIPHYLIVNSSSDNDKLSVSYWTTYGIMGNQLKAGTQLLADENAVLDARSIYLETMTTGGSKPLTAQEKNVRFKNILTSRNRIITWDDVTTFCLAEYPSLISDVRIKHGVMCGGTAKRSLLRTIDVIISIHDNMAMEINKEEFCQSLGSKLKSRSPETFNYRILLQ